MGGILLIRETRIIPGGGTCKSAAMSTTNLTWTDLESNPSLRSERPKTNRLRNGQHVLIRIDF